MGTRQRTFEEDWHGTYRKREGLQGEGSAPPGIRPDVNLEAMREEAGRRRREGIPNGGYASTTAAAYRQEEARRQHEGWEPECARWGRTSVRMGRVREKGMGHGKPQSTAHPRI